MLNKTTLLLSGGGFKGFAYVGVIKAFEELNVKFKILCGTSIGSIFCLLINLKFTSKKILEILKKIKYNELFYAKPSIDNLLLNFGFSDGNYATSIIKYILKKRVGNENITFRQLYDKTKQELIITSLCLNDSDIEFFSYKNYPNMCVYKAIRMSISLPYIYKPVIYNDKYYVDSGIADNLPLYNFNEDTTLAILLCSKDTYKKDITNLKNYTTSIIEFLFSKQIMYKNIIKLVTNINSLDYNISNDDIENLINIGYNTIHKYKNKKTI